MMIGGTYPPGLSTGVEVRRYRVEVFVKGLLRWSVYASFTNGKDSQIIDEAHSFIPEYYRRYVQVVQIQPAISARLTGGVAGKIIFYCDRINIDNI